MARGNETTPSLVLPDGFPEQEYNVVTTVREPGLMRRAEHSVDGPLSLRELSARYPRSRRCGGLVLAIYVRAIDDHASEEYIQRITSAVEGVRLKEDPRLFDDELDPDELPLSEGYEVGDGYPGWQARINTADNVHYKSVPPAEPDL